MYLCIVIGVALLMVAIIVFITIRQQLKQKAVAFDNDIESTLTSPTLSIYDRAREKTGKDNTVCFDDIEAVIEQRYDGCYIPGRGEQEVTDYFSDIFNEAYSLRNRLEAFHIEPSYKLDKLISDYGSLHSLIKKHNEGVRHLNL